VPVRAGRSLVCLLGVVACVAAGCTGKPTAAHNDISTWKSYDEPGFSAKFPSVPKKETQPLSQPGFHVDLTIYRADLGTSHYTVSFVTYPTTIDVSNPRSNLSGALTGALQNSGLKNPHLVKQTSNTVSGSPGMELEASADNAYVFLEAVLKDHTLFQVLTGNDMRTPPSSAQAFIDSVMLK
jgi:hypothetical protein